MMNSRDIAAHTGRMMLTPQQMRHASLPNVMTMFTASGISESERLEMAHMMQRFIIEGYTRGINVPKMMQEREAREGKLHFGFAGDAVPHRNTVQFDVNQWRTSPTPHKMRSFMNKVGTRLTALPRGNDSPRRSIVPERWSNTRSGAPKRPYNSAHIDAVARDVGNVVLPDTMKNVFDGLQSYQARQGYQAPQMMQERSYAATIPMPQLPPTTETRERMIERGADPVQVGLMAPRMGIATPQTTTVTGVQGAIAATGRPNAVLIYNGPGTWSSEVQNTASNLASLGIKYDIVDDLSGVNYSEYGAFMMPGGNAGSEWNGGNVSEWGRLKQAINDGLNYYGNCAGGFFVGDWGNGLGLTDTLIDYPSYGPVSQYFDVELWDGTTRSLPFLGGPGFDQVLRNTPGARELGSFPNGEAGIVSFNYGSGHVIIDAFHPSVENAAGSDPDGSDDELNKLLLRAIVTGQDPDGVLGPVGGVPPGGTTTTTNTTINKLSPQVNPSAGAVASLSGTTGARRTDFRKTPTVGRLPEGAVPQTFAAGLQAIINQPSQSIGQTAGALLRGRK